MQHMNLARAKILPKVSITGIQGGPKTDTLGFVRLDFIKYRPILKLISLSASG